MKAKKPKASTPKPAATSEQAKSPKPSDLPPAKASSKKPGAKAKAKPRPAATPSAAAKPAKQKRIRGSFSMPERDYAVIAELKARSKKRGRAVKKNELLRAGLQALKAMDDTTLQTALGAIAQAKGTAPK